VGGVCIPKLFIENHPWELFWNDITASAYEDRCLALAETGDIVITTNAIDASFISYLQIYGLACKIELLTPKKCGRDLADAILLDENLLNYLRKRVEDGNWSIETFLYGQSLLKLAEKLNISINGNPELYAKYGTKSGFRRLAKRIGIPIPAGLILEQPIESQRIQNFIQLHGSAILKEDDTLGGFGIGGLTSPDGVRKQLRQDCPYVIEKEIKFMFQGSVQATSSRRNLELLVVETCTKNYEFQGFEYPPTFKVANFVEQAFKLFSILRNEGFLGYAGVDFVFVHEGNVFFHDLNIRKTAVRYWVELVKHILGLQWRSTNIIANEITLKTPITTFREVLDKGKRFLLPSKRSPEGVILYNAGLIPFGRIGVIAISKYNRSQQVLNEFLKAIAQ
jgi:hypothetical protein